MNLPNWQQVNQLLPHQTSPDEIHNLLQLADRDLRACQATGLDEDWRFQIAYNAALQIAIAALYATGFAVPKQESAHVKAIQSLAHTMGISSREVAVMERYRKIRREATYETAGLVSAAEATEMFQFATRLRAAIASWLAQQYPELLAKK